MKREALKKYRMMRDFRKTAEPRGGKWAHKKDNLLFVIQKHAARRLHYDFRIEVDGVLKSWAVPKGPSVDPEDKRLAIQTEDHPMEYAAFEGVIPSGQYGAGKVIVWDLGIYRNLSWRRGKIVPIQEALRKGHVILWLEGKKLHGAYALMRMEEAEGQPWLLRKMKEGVIPKKQPVLSKPASVLSGKVLEEIG